MNGKRLSLILLFIGIIVVIALCVPETHSNGNSTDNFDDVPIGITVTMETPTKAVSSDTLSPKEAFIRMYDAREAAILNN